MADYSCVVRLPGPIEASCERVFSALLRLGAGLANPDSGRITSWGEEGDYVESLDYHDVLSKALRGRIRNV
ncbi:hypothetical protein [Lysobacter antibioticus]|uniref:hypothetical protein n=1 Tax=Lysobacter antibioticus TaxID=84531 RepID=UPI0007E8DD21|nr:hypothetical protein [Lysobacter antibioticus]